MNIGLKGANGEKRVAQFLRNRGFAVVKTNYQCRYGEIDIIAENDEYILFTEVKTRKDDSMISGALAVDANKQRRLQLTAQDYMVKTACEKQPRFDVAEVTIYKKADGHDGYKLRYIENAF